MAEPQAVLPLRALPPDHPLPPPGPFYLLPPNPPPGYLLPSMPPTPSSSAPLPSPSAAGVSAPRTPKKGVQWEAAARAWLAGFAGDSLPAAADIDSWVKENEALVPDEVKAMEPEQLHQKIIALKKKVDDSNLHPYRFQRTDLWKPAYRWLESLQKDVLVTTREIAEWLDTKPEETAELREKHTRYHLLHYIQRMHLKLLKKHGKIPKSLQLSAARASVKLNNVGLVARSSQDPGIHLCVTKRDKKMSLSKRKEAFLKFELLTDLQNCLLNVLSKHMKSTDTKDSGCSLMAIEGPEVDVCTKLRLVSKGSLYSNEVADLPSIAKDEPLVKECPESDLAHNKKRNPIVVTPAWSYSEVPNELPGTNQPSSSQSEVTSFNMWKANGRSTIPKRTLKKNIFVCLLGREMGVSWPQVCFDGGYAGRSQENWVSFLKGWHSVENQFDGPSVIMSRKHFISWSPTWCAYTSSAGPSQLTNRQSVRKVLGIKFHPDGLPQLVCSSNEGPNELVLFNLLSGRAVQLRGHNCLIEAVDFAVKGASVVSCGSNLLKVWDCITGSCLYTLGGADRNSPGHTQKINAMAVNKWQSCLVVTSGSTGDGKLLLWNALRGELASDLNSNLRSQELVYPCIDVMEFCSENLLACGSDCDYGGSAVVQLWDIDSPESFLSFTASDSYISSLRTDPSGNTLITGSGDGTIGLFDVRTCSATNYLSVGVGYEVTSVSFSDCGTYICAASTSNNTLVWDTRLIPVNRSCDVSRQCYDMRFYRPLHCLSHGKQMLTAEYAGQLPGHVNEGYQGVNDARWLRGEPILITASGNGSIGMWDVTLGQPCVRQFVSHSRSANKVDVAHNGEYFCSGGDDQKIVLYHRRTGRNFNWRLSHPLPTSA